VRKKKSQTPKPISEKQRESDDLLRRELEQADPEKFKRLIRPLFRSSKTEERSGG
jgi:chorismate mutase